MTITLVPGWAMSAAVFGPLQERLDYRSRVTELPGFGDRRKETCPTRLGALATQLNPGTPAGVLLGWSLGGMACIEWALQQPQGIRGLILLCSTPRFVMSSDWPQGTGLDNFHAFREAFRQNWQKSLRRFLLMQAGKTSGDSRALATAIGQLSESTPEPDPQSMDNGLEILAHADLRDKLAELKLPVLVVCGLRDRICHPDASRWMASQISNSRLVELDSGHAPQLSHTRELAAEINTFAEQVA